MLLGVPVVAIGLPLVFSVLVRIYPVGREPMAKGAAYVRDELRQMGPMSGPETVVALVFGLVAALWIFGPLVREAIPSLSDTAIAMGGALLLFLVPADWRRMEFVLDWRSAEALPWGVLILFGGGLSLAAAIQATGLAAYVGALLVGLGGLPTLAVVAVIALVILLLTEMTSNTATAAAFLPVVAALALALGESPLLLAVPTALAASCAFALPVGTPPNAIVFGSNLVTLPEMARAGVWLNLAFVVLVTAAAYLLLPLVFGVVYGQVPAWASP
jgi:sodium-dependent dicarboxylate transporter 2/3/5